MKYILGIWRDHLKQTGKKKLPLVVPIVFYHGRKPYIYSKDIRDLIDAPKPLVESVLFEPFHLIDTYKIQDEVLPEHPWVGIMAFFMKHIFEKDILPYLREVMPILRQLEKLDGSNFVQILLKYVLTTAETLNLEAFVEVVQEGLSESTGENVMTIAEQLIERGIKKGFLRCGHEVLLRLLKKKFSNVPTHYQELVEQADETKIYKWSENIIDAKTLEEVFG